MVNNIIRTLILFYFSSIFFTAFAQEVKDFSVVSIAFYNVENLFDTQDDPQIFDEDFTPTGKNRWTEELYYKKQENLSFAINSIGNDQIKAPPAILGLSEIENLQVLEDLVNMPLLAPYDYQIIHFDSPDERGIDVALLYRPDIFVAENSVNHSLLIYDRKSTSKRDYTRDQLVVTGSLDGEEIHVVVNHWPSRSGGEKASNYKRENAAKLNKNIIDSLHRKDPYARIINMGDFNDDPHDNSLKKILGAKARKEQVEFGGLYNPFAAIALRGTGTSAYRDQWNFFDQIILSQSLIEKDPSKFTFFRAYVFNPPFLVTAKGPYKNYPFRSFGSSGFTGGFSDHFPVYILLIKELD
ncbi:endonuclease/exonuclease/phosphatase family protein [Salinimicrobium terrae]|uniref:endonuclease/exonuclease/phosphatase family protein n=1 Tax=Salinimicrobium terrae TaxID=470866 RepID=UPI0004248DF7|nr:endonuclease/exonuclease/phosphatase family protein [Salinimicrobium terrae]